MQTTNHLNPSDRAESDDSRARTPSTLLTVPEACAELRVSRWMLYRLVQTRRLVTIKIGSRRFVPRADLHALIESLRSAETS